MEEEQISKTMTVGKAIIILFSYISFGAVFYRIFENMRWVDAYYFVVVTLSTIGYGDFSPKTDIGKIFTIFYIIMGVVVFATGARYIISSWNNNRRSKRQL